MKYPRPSFLLVSGLLLAAGAAQAGRTLTLTYSLGSTVTHDANLYRLAPGVDPQATIGSSDKSDTVTTTSIGIVADKEFGIQRLKLDLRLNNSRYRRFSQLDNEGYSHSGTWQWALGRRLHGGLSYSRSSQLSSFVDTLQTSRSINTRTAYRGNAHFQVAPDWDLFGGLGQEESVESAANRQSSNYTNHTFDAGLRHASTAGHQLALLWRRIDSEETRQDDIEVSGVYAWSAMTRLSGAVGRSRRLADGSASSGATGRLNLDWNPSPKLRFNLAARQEISAAANDFSTTTDARGLVFGASWAPTSKTRLQFSLDRTTKKYTNDTFPRLDHLRNIGLALFYQPDHWLSLSLSLRDEDRDSNLPGYTYRDRLAAAALQFAF